MDWNQVIEFLSRQEVLIALCVILVLLVILLIYRNSKKKAYRKQLDEFQVRYNSVKSTPLSLKMSKVVSLSKMDPTIKEKIQDFKDAYDAIQANNKNTTDMLAQMEDQIIAGRLKDLKLTVIDLDGLLTTGEKNTAKLDDELNIALKPETEQRDEINVCKEKFRELRNDWNMNGGALAFSEDAIIAKINNVEKKFSQFEEEMYNSEYDKAKQTNEEISTDIADLENVFNKLPALLSEARGIIPKQIDQVSETYSITKQKGVFLQHLDVARNIEIITDSLKQDLYALKNLNMANAEEHFNDYKTRLSQISDQINKEDAAYNEVIELAEASFRKLDTTTDIIENINKTFDDIEDISRKQILANDVMYNILFGKGFCIKDTDEFSKSYLNYENTLYYNKKRFFHECYLFLIDDFFTEFVNKIPALRQKYCSAEGNILDFMNCFRYYLNDAEGRDIVYLKDTVKSRNQSKSLKPHYIRK